MPDTKSHSIRALLSRTTGRPIDAADSFFAHHGPWAPGVRMFRMLQFRTKAFIISIVFFAPIALLAWDFLASNAATKDFADTERSGVIYLREAVPLVRLAQHYRRAHANGGSASDVAEARKALDAQMVKLEAVARSLDADFGEAKALAEAKSAAETVANAGSATVFQAHTAHIEAIVALIGQVTDGSNLTLDPDLDTFYLMDAALDALPTIVVTTGNLRGLSLLAARSDEPVGAGVQRQITSNAVTSQTFHDRLKVSLRKVLGVRPEYNGEFNVDKLDRSTQQNAALVEQTAAAASGLEDQARDLAVQVARFSLPAAA